MFKTFRTLVGRIILAIAVLLAIGFATSNASAQSDIPSTVTTLNTYWTTIEGLALLVVLFVIGRRLLRKV